MRKKVIVSTIILVLTISMLSSIAVDRAQYALIAPTLEIWSPHAYFTEIYTNTTIDVEIAVTRLKDGPEIKNLYYSVDGYTLNTLELVKDPKLFAFGPDKTGYIYYGRTILENLPEGNYTLIAHAMDENGRTFSDSIDFRIDLDYEPPRVVLLSPLNQTYADSQIPLIFAANGQIIKNAYYLLEWNGRERIQITGNTTLRGLSDGSHVIYLSVDTEKGHSVSIMTFNVNSTQTDNPLQAVVIIIVVAVVVVAGLLVYHKKHKAV
jgi:hypothetical protein